MDIILSCSFTFIVATFIPILFQISVIILIDFLKTSNINLLEPQALIEHNKVIELFTDEVNSAMDNFSNYETIKNTKVIIKKPKVLLISHYFPFTNFIFPSYLLEISFF